jgi:hypothetical protein
MGWLRPGRCGPQPEVHCLVVIKLIQPVAKIAVLIGDRCIVFAFVAQALELLAVEAGEQKTLLLLVQASEPVAEIRHRHSSVVIPVEIVAALIGRAVIAVPAALVSSAVVVVPAALTTSIVVLRKSYACAEHQGTS